MPGVTLPSCLGALQRPANWTRNPHVWAVVAVAPGVLVEVLLVVALGVAEGAGVLGGPHLCGDGTETVALQHGLEGLPRRTCRCFLIGGRPVDRAPVLRAAIVALAVALRRVVVLPEGLEQKLRGGQ